MALMGSKSLGTLTIDLIAKTGGFTAGMDKAGRSSSKFKKQTESDMKAIAGFAKTGFLALSGAAIGLGAGLLKMANDGRAAIDSQAKLARQIDSTSKEIAILTRAGELAGVGLSQITNSALKLSINAGKAEQGLMAQKRSFDALGLSVKEIMALPLSERYLAVNKAINENVKANERAAVAADIFGAKNASLIALLDAPTIARAAKETELLGLNISEIDAAGIEAANDAFSTLDKAMQGASQQIAIQLAPAFEGIGDSFLAMVEDAGGVAAIIEGMTERGAIALNLLGDTAILVSIILSGRLAASAGVASLTFAKGTIELIRYQFALGRMAGSSAVATVGFLGLAAGARAASVAMAFLGGPVGAVLTAATALIYFGAKAGDAEKDSQDLQGRIEKLSASFNTLSQNQAKSAIIDFEDALISANKEVAIAQAKAETYAVRLKGLGSSSPKFKEYTNELVRQNAEYDTASEKVKGLEERLLKLREIATTGKPVAIVDTGEGSAEKKLSEYQKLEAALRKELLLIGLVGDAAKLEATVTAGMIEGVTQAEGMKLVALQKQIDAKNKLIDKAKELADAETFNDIFADYDEGTAALVKYEKILDRINAANLSGAEQAELMRLAFQDFNDELDDAVGGADFWGEWTEGAEAALMSFDELNASVLENFQSRFGDAFEAMIFDSESLGDAFGNMMEGMARAVVNSIGQMIAQWVAYQIVQSVVGKSTAAASQMALVSQAQAMSVMAGLNAFSSTAAIPIVGPVAAPGAAAAALAATQPMAAAVSAFAMSGMAHDGIDAVPETGTWLLQKGERVTTSETSAKLDRTLDGIKQGKGASGGGDNMKISLGLDSGLVMQNLRNDDDFERLVVNIIRSNQ